MKLRRIASLLAWLLFGVIAYSTLSPIGMRPHIGSWVHVERFGAFGLLGLLFMIAYPGRLPFVIAIVLGTAVGFELLQMLSMDRHARLEDLAVKLAGGACGIAAGWFIARRLPRINQNSNYPG
ncbi:VanZ family protein [Ensifer sp. IC3342]|nr:VanZ family protein [Ensifer sp. BRP08]MCA1446314.1 VanZ family protein [Ensifer sp. IC3342]